MNEFCGYYSIIQYCPDMKKSEAANIGVALICPDLNFSKVLINPSNKRIEKFFGKQDWEQIDLFKNGIQTRFENEKIDSLESFESFISSRANLIRYTAPESIRISDPEENIHLLYEELFPHSVYCESCGACGVEGCCPPTKCETIKCMYGDRYKKDYSYAMELTNQLWDLIGDQDKSLIEKRDKLMSELYDKIYHSD